MWSLKKRKARHWQLHPESLPSEQYPRASRPIHLRPEKPELVVGYVLVVSFPKTVRQAYEKLLEIPEIVELYVLFGSYDFIAKVQARDRNGLRAAEAKIASIDAIITTKLLETRKG
jgi:DNA-binding Lrp family transcriptional regulator